MQLKHHDNLLNHGDEKETKTETSCVTFERLYPYLINDTQIRVEPVGQALRVVGVVRAAAGPVGRAVVHPVLRLERVLHALGGEIVGAGGADAVQDAGRGGLLGGDEGAAEVGVYPVVLLAAPLLCVLAGLGGARGGRRRSGDLDRAGEVGDLGAYPHAQALAEFVADYCRHNTSGASNSAMDPGYRRRERECFKKIREGDGKGKRVAYRIGAKNGRRQRRGRGRRGRRRGGRYRRRCRGRPSRGSPSRRSPPPP
jgi:hypothetical protein